MLAASGEMRPLEELENEIIRFAIAHYRGQMSEVARRLGWPKAFAWDTPAAVFREHAALSAYANNTSRMFDLGALVTLTDADFHLAPGEVLVLCTDGVIERRDGGRMLGEEGLAEVLAGVGSGATAESIAIAVERAVMEFASGAPEDDVAIVVVRPTGDAAGLC